MKIAKFFFLLHLVISFQFFEKIMATTKTQVFIVYYSMYGHVRKMAEEVKKGVEKVGDVEATIYQVAETLPKEVLEKMHALPKDDRHPVITANDLKRADGVIFGIPTRYGSSIAQIKAFMDSTGGLWVSGALVGKPAGVFFSTATPGGGQETTALTFLTHFVHHGMIYVPLGYVNPSLMDLKEVHGGSPYGAGTFAGPDGSRQPTALELSLANSQGEIFAKTAKALKIGREVLADKKQ